MAMKPAPYCTPALLSALTDAAKRLEVPKPLRETMRSRGWINQRGAVTQKGLDYLASRKVSY